ncbi:MAG: NADPH-dependent FMN reductase [Pseudomonadales bacterium]
MRVLGVSGSLRAGSTNHTLLQAAGALAPANITFELSDWPGQLPLFSPDQQDADIPALKSWAAQVKAADALVLSVPEYAGGYPGALKNALDWLVNTDAFVAKPFALLKASKRTVVAQDTLVTVLQTMSGVHVIEADQTVSLLGKSLSATEVAADPASAESIAALFAALAAATSREPHHSTS